jgi:carbon monoxide dehydrogenase subunit G
MSKQGAVMNITSRIEIARPSAEVFGFVANYENDTRWRDGVLTMEARGPIAAGTPTHERLRFLGSTYITEGIITERTERRMSFRGSSASVDSSGYREVEAVGDRTRVTYSLSLRPRGLLRLFSPILRVLYASRVARDLRRLRDLLES